VTTVTPLSKIVIVGIGDSIAYLGVLAPPTTASPLLVVVVAYEYAAVDIGLDDIDDDIVRREAVAVAVAVAVGWWPRRERHAARRSTMLITILLAERV
jgi:hypothetical protein